MLPIDHDTVRDVGDRTRSLELVDRLRVESDDEECQRLVVALCSLDDPRTVPALEALLLDVQADASARAQAGDVLRELCNTPSPSDLALREWWTSDDELLREHALLQMGHLQKDIVDAVLADPRHPHYLSAIRTLTFGFSSPATADHLTTALQDSRTDVRRAAAASLIWDEPLCALEPLLRGAGDSDALFAEDCLDTLCYYPTLATLQTANALRDHRDPEVQNAARNCFQRIRYEMLSQLADVSLEGHLRNWLSPVWHLLDIAQAEIDEQRAPLAKVPRCRDRQWFAWLSTPELFADHIGSMESRWAYVRRELSVADWSRVDESQRDQLAETLLNWPDSLVRERAARAFVDWNDRDRMVALTQDKSLMVRKAAMFHMRDMGPDAELAAHAWSRASDVRSTHLYECIGTAIKLSEPGSWWERVRLIVADETQEEAVRFHMIHHLGKAGARNEIAASLHLLHRKPVLTWSVHEALVEWALKMELPLPDLSHLADVDHLSVQSMLGSLPQ